MSSAPRKTSVKPLKAKLSALNTQLKRTGSTIKKLTPTIASVGTLKERHIARRQPSGLNLVLADRIDFLNPSHWDALCAGSVFLSRAYLRVLEAHGPDNIEPRYALAYDEAGQPAALMVFQRVHLTGDRLRKPGSKKLIGKPLATLDEHMLVCGNLLVWGARGLAFAPALDEAQLWHAVGEASYRLRRADKLLGESNVLMIKDFDAGNALAKSSLRLLGYRPP
jgi:hypothetical protein